MSFAPLTVAEKMKAMDLFDLFHALAVTKTANRKAQKANLPKLTEADLGDTAMEIDRLFSLNTVAAPLPKRVPVRL